MNLLRTYLWKEWREQRAALGLLALGLIAVTVVLAAVLSRESWQLPVSYDWVVGMCLGAALFIVGSDLLPRDLRSGPRQFLERAPAGLRTAFLGKLIFLGGVMLAAAGFGILLATATAKLRTGELPTEFFALGQMKHTEEILLAAIAVVFWVLAVSAWVSTSAMAIPAALIFLGVCAWPWWFLVRELDAFQVGSWPSTLFTVLIAVGGLVTAWWSFAVGSSRSRARRVAVLGGMGLALLFFLPPWALAGARYCEWRGARIAILDGMVGLGERYAFLDLVQRESLSPNWHFSPISSEETRWSSALLLDLEDGSWSFEGERGSSTFSPASDTRFLDTVPGVAPHSRFVLFQPASGEVESYFDSRTGRRIAPNTPVTPSTGITPEDFGLARPTKWSPVDWVGVGHRIRVRNPGEESRWIYRDPARDLTVDLTELLPGEVARSTRVVSIFPDRWLAREGGCYLWLDPLTGERESCDWFREGDHFWTTVDDGTLMISTREGTVRLDPVSGERHALKVLGARDPSPGVALPYLEGGMPLPAESACVVSVGTNRTWSTVGLLDLSAGTLRLPPEDWDIPGSIRLELLCSEGPRATVVEDFRRVVRYDFAAETREVIFDVKQLCDGDERGEGVER